MRHLIIYAHPNKASLNHHLLEAAVGYLENDGHEVVIRDLYELQFDPVLSLEDMDGQRRGIVDEKVRAEQRHIEWAGAITFIYPIWWTGLPAILKGYIERVMSYGFAYRYDQGVQKGLLTGKKAYIFNTHGKSNEEYTAIEMDKALLLTSDKGIYTYCGLEVKSHLWFGQADRASGLMISEWVARIQSAYN